MIRKLMLSIFMVVSVQSAFATGPTLVFWNSKNAASIQSLPPPLQERMKAMSATLKGETVYLIPRLNFESLDRELPGKYERDSYYFEYDLNYDQFLVDILNVDPAKIWSTRRAKLGVTYSRTDHEFYFPGDSSRAEFKVGVGFLTNIHAFGSNVAVTNEIVSFRRGLGSSISPTTMEFRYTVGDSSQGSQILFVTRAKNGKTQIHHYTKFWTDSSVSDGYLFKSIEPVVYPYIHRKIIMSVHENLAKELKTQVRLD